MIKLIIFYTSHSCFFTISRIYKYYTVHVVCYNFSLGVIKNVFIFPLRGQWEDRNSYTGPSISTWCNFSFLCYCIIFVCYFCVWKLKINFLTLSDYITQWYCPQQITFALCTPFNILYMSFLGYTCIWFYMYHKFSNRTRIYRDQMRIVHTPYRIHE
jgi:hypothetical protein